MRFDGKRPEEMDKDELEAAAVYCVRTITEADQLIAQAQGVRELNKAGLAELAIEYDRRFLSRAN